MIRGKAPVYALMIVLLALTPLTALSYSTYNPPWYNRVYIGTIPLDDVSGIATGNKIVYAMENFYASNSNTYDVGLTAHSVSTGEVQYATYVYSSAGYDVIGNDIIYSPDGYLYLVGALVENTTHWYGMVLKIDPSDFSIVAQYLLNETKDGFKTTFYGVCMDPRGSIIAVGRQIYNGNGTHYGVLLGLDNQLNPFYRVRLSLTSYGYNFTLYDCTYLDGYIHSIGNVLWYDSSTALNYIIYTAILSHFANLSVSNELYIRAVSANGYVYRDYKNDISTDGVNLYTAFTYMDSYDTSAGSVVILDSSLNILRRINYSSTNWERLGEISCASDGSFVVGGETFDDYGTGLGTDYYHGVVLVFDNTNRVRKAVLYGASDNGSLVGVTAINSSGYVFTGGVILSDNLAFYDVTQEVTSVIQSTTPNPKKTYTPRTGEVAMIPEEAVVPPDKLELRVQADKAPESASVKLSQGRSLDVKVTPSGASSALLVSYDVSLAPPPPIPEGRFVALAVGLAALMVASRVVYSRSR